MGLFKRLTHLFKKPGASAKTDTQLGAAPVAANNDSATCPVCWGFQEYDAKIREKYRDKRIDVKNHVGSYLKSKRFQVENIDGLRYRKPSIKECPKCGKNMTAGIDHTDIQ